MPVSHYQPPHCRKSRGRCRVGRDSFDTITGEALTGWHVGNLHSTMVKLYAQRTSAIVDRNSSKGDQQSQAMGQNR